MDESIRIAEQDLGALDTEMIGEDKDVEFQVRLDRYLVDPNTL